MFATNSRVNEYNEHKPAELPGEQRHLKALDKKPNVLKEYTTKSDPRYTGGLPEVLHLAVGARVMLTRNLDVWLEQWLVFFQIGHSYPPTTSCDG